VKDTIINNIFSVTPDSFSKVANEVYAFQLQNNKVFSEWVSVVSGEKLVERRAEELVVSDEELVARAETHHLITNHRFLPISFFKLNEIKTTIFNEEAIFESSGTTNTTNSRHFIKDLSVYRTSFMTTFHQFYGSPTNWCIVGLLPSYLERNNSSLVLMVQELIIASNNSNSGFYLHDYEALKTLLVQQENNKLKTLLIGVTFALLDFAEQYPIPLKYTTIMETGGMKGRRKELTRAEVHGIITTHLGVEKVHSEYGMTELLSQGYSIGDGRFTCPPWMKVLVRDEDDPLTIRPFGKGVLNIIDLANIYSCSFIATDDVGVVYEDGSFEVWGRLDNSDIRGCSLLVV